MEAKAQRETENDRTEFGLQRKGARQRGGVVGWVCGEGGGKTERSLEFIQG